jgi:hypothetical protein
METAGSWNTLTAAEVLWVHPIPILQEAQMTKTQAQVQLEQTIFRFHAATNEAMEVIGKAMQDAQDAFADFAEAIKEAGNG